MRLLNWIFGPEREAKHLVRDTDYILNALQSGHYGAADAGAVATQVHDELAFVQERFSHDKYGAIRGRDYLQRLHKEARNRNDQQTLTSLTLALIYLRAEALEDLGRPTKERLDRFLAQWAHAFEVDKDGNKLSEMCRPAQPACAPAAPALEDAKRNADSS